MKNKVENKENNSSIEYDDPEDDLSFNWFTKIPLINKEETLSIDNKFGDAQPFSIDFEINPKKDIIMI